MNFEQKVLYKIASLIFEFSGNSDRDYDEFFDKEKIRKTLLFIETDEEVFNNKMDFNLLADEFTHILFYAWRVYDIK